ncbi:MAG: hypothetical protein Q8O71_01125 [bacterium]|nr:hypothetical protein [bacterium]
MIELLSTIGMIIGALFAAYERHRRKKMEQTLQNEVDLLHNNPGLWLQHHFPGMPKKQDIGPTKTDD